MFLHFLKHNNFTIVRLLLQCKVTVMKCLPEVCLNKEDFVDATKACHFFHMFLLNIKCLGYEPRFAVTFEFDSNSTSSGF